MNISQLCSVYETAQEECQRFASAEYEDALALARQDAALGAQMRALESLSQLRSNDLSEILLKFDVWQSNHKESEFGTLSPQSDALIKSIYADLIRIARQ